MSSRSYPSGAAKKKLKKSRETESLKNVPKLTSLGFKSKPKVDGNDDGVQKEICELTTEGQNQTISTVQTITDATDIEAVRSELESSCEETSERPGNDDVDVDESVLVSPFSNDAAQWTEITEDLRHYWASNGPKECQR